MINTIISMYVTLMPPILAGILNMIWMKLPILKKIQTPIDCNKNFIDKKRIFGNHKTWKGIIGYLILNIIMMPIWGFICKITSLGRLNYFYIQNENTLVFNLLIGLLLGLAYSLFELPNSFLKRRLDIAPGKTPSGLKKIIFVILDQADSVFGCVLVVWLFYDMTFSFYFIYVALGAITHIILNMILYFLKLRKNMF